MVLKVAVTGTTEGKSGRALDVVDYSIRNNDEDSAVFTKTCLCAVLSREIDDGSTELTNRRGDTYITSRTYEYEPSTTVFTRYITSVMATTGNCGRHRKVR
jgi:hypothetical protein